MNKRKRQFWTAVLSLVGAIVGVGIFGVPYVISQVGALPAMAYFLVLGGVMIFQHLFFVEAAIACRANHNLPGLAKLYLGPSAGRIGGLALILGYWASLTAYVLVGGSFLAAVFSPLFGGGTLIYTVVWAMAGALVVKYGLKTVSRFEVVGTVGLLLALVGILGASLPRVQAANLLPVTWIDPIVPYGVILFSIAGLTAVPEMERLVEGRAQDYRRSVVLGTVIAGLITAAFGFIVWGVTGEGVTQDAVSGLKAVLGPAIAVPAAIAGFLAIATSYFATAANVKHVFEYDYRLDPTVAWLLAVTPPLVVFLFGGRNFLTIIGFSGAVFGGIVAVLVGLIYVSVRKRGLVRHDPLPVPAAVAWGVIGFMSLGALVEILDYVRRFFAP